MRFVKIGDTYFNPVKIECIEPRAIGTNPYEPYVYVCTTCQSHGFNAHDLGFDIPVCTEKLVALGVADAMVATVVDIVNEAL